MGSMRGGCVGGDVERRGQSGWGISGGVGCCEGMENEWYNFGRRTLGMAYGRIVVGTKGGHIESRLHGLLEKVQTMAVFDALAKQRSGSVLGLSCSH